MRLGYIGQQYMRNDSQLRRFSIACQRNAAPFILTDGFANNASGADGADLHQDHLGQRRAVHADLRQHSGRYFSCTTSPPTCGPP